MNDERYGIAVYDIGGSFDPPKIEFSGRPCDSQAGLQLGHLTVAGVMNGKGELNGDWSTSLGTGGTFVLYPHHGGEQSDTADRIEQLHTARHNFGAIEIDRQQITELAERLGRDFPNVIVTVTAGTEQSRYLADFKKLKFSVDRAEIIKIHASKPDGFGSNQVISIEFGPNVNYAMTQGASEAWVLGQLETLKRDLRRFERNYITNFKKWGIGVNQLMLLGAIVFLPGLSSLLDRSILMVVVLTLIAAVNWLHSRYVPFAAIHLAERQKSYFGRIWPSIASWVIGIAAAVIAALLAAYLEGWLRET